MYGPHAGKHDGIKQKVARVSKSTSAVLLFTTFQVCALAVWPESTQRPPYVKMIVSHYVVSRTR